MKYKKIILAGGSGYLGTVLASYFRHDAERIIILSRTSKPADGNVTTLVWDGKSTGNWTSGLEGAELLINLSGKNVNCRYTAENKRKLMASRIEPTTLLGDAIAQLSAPPKLWINITSATIYRHAEDRPQDELTGETGYGFSIDICNAWEKCFFGTPTPQTRKVALRMAIVMGRADGAFPRLLNLVKAGMGGRQGDGTQYVSWVHEHDAARVADWLYDHSEISGVVNCSAPNAVTNTELMRVLRNAYGIPFGLPCPAWLLEMGAALIGTETELILKSRWVYPARLTQGGFKFEYPDVKHAFHDLLSIRQ